MTINFQHSVPVWVRYVVYKDATSDKFYEVRVDQEGGRFYLTKRWGRRPDTRGGQSSQADYATELAAVTTAEHAVDQKVAKGYWNEDWPFGEVAMPDFSRPEEVERWLSM